MQTIVINIVIEKRFFSSGRVDSVDNAIHAFKMNH